MRIQNGYGELSCDGLQVTPRKVLEGFIKLRKDNLREARPPKKSEEPHRELHISLQEPGMAVRKNLKKK